MAYLSKAEIRGPRLRLFLAIPVILSASTCVGYASGYYKLQEFEAWVFQCKANLNVGWAPHADQLPLLALLFAVIAGLVCIGLILIPYKSQWFFGTPDESSS